MRIILTCALCLFCGCLLAEESEFVKNRNILADYTAEWGSMRAAHANCVSHLDVDCESTSKIDLYYFATALAHISAKKVLPIKYRRYLESTDMSFKAEINDEYKGIALRVRF